MAKWEPDVSNKAFHRGGYPLYVVKCFWPKSKTFLLTMEHVLLVAKWQNICCKKQNYSVLSLSLDHTNIDSILAWPHGLCLDSPCSITTERNTDSSSPLFAHCPYKSPSTGCCPTELTLKGYQLSVSYSSKNYLGQTSNRKFYWESLENFRALLVKNTKNVHTTFTSVSSFFDCFRTLRPA